MRCPHGLLFTLLGVGAATAVEYTFVKQTSKLTKVCQYSWAVSQDWSTWIVGRTPAYSGGDKFTISTTGAKESNQWTDGTIAGYNPGGKKWSGSGISADGTHIVLCHESTAKVSINSGASWNQVNGSYGNFFETNDYDWATPGVQEYNYGGPQCRAPSTYAN